MAGFFWFSIHKTKFFPTFAGSFFGRVGSSRRDDTCLTLDKRSAVGGDTNKRLPQCFDRLSNHVTALHSDNNNITNNKINNTMKIKSLIKHNLMRAAMTLLVMLPWAANAQTRECNPITTYPWTENFDSYTGTTSGSTNNLPECWNYINTCTHNSYKGYPVVYGANYTSGHSGHNFLYFESYYQYDPKPQYAILPKMSGLAGKHITLWAYGYLSNGGTCTFKIGTMSNPADANTFAQIAEQTLTNGWQEYMFTVPETSNTYLAIMIDAASGYNVQKEVGIDDIAVFGDFSQTGDNEYTIFTAAGWGLFCDAIAGGESFSGKTVKLGADITITRMACDENHKFNGTFNGQGHTLTVNYGSADNPIDTEFVAPFVCSGGNPVFLNLTIAGHIYSTYTCNNPDPHSAHTGTGGLIGHLYGTVTIEHCMSNVEITVTGEQYASGFVGLCEHTVNFNDCMSSAVIHSQQQRLRGLEPSLGLEYQLHRLRL